MMATPKAKSLGLTKWIRVLTDPTPSLGGRHTRASRFLGAAAASGRRGLPLMEREEGRQQHTYALAGVAVPLPVDLPSRTPIRGDIMPRSLDERLYVFKRCPNLLRVCQTYDARARMRDGPSKVVLTSTVSKTSRCPAARLGLKPEGIQCESKQRLRGDCPAREQRRPEQRSHRRGSVTSMPQHVRLVSFLLGSILVVRLHAQGSAQWKDSSPHRTRFVSVEEKVHC